MIHYLKELPAVFLLLFISVTFLFSFWDKISDWNGNIIFLKEHFKNTFVVLIIPIILVFIVILEVLAGLFSLIGVYYYVFKEKPHFGIISCILSLTILFIFLIGQRIAKDFDGAMKITIYIIPCVFCLYLLTK